MGHPTADTRPDRRASWLDLLLLQEPTRLLGTTAHSASRQPQEPVLSNCFDKMSFGKSVAEKKFWEIPEPECFGMR